MSTFTPIFNQYNKNLAFGEQCQIESSLEEQRYKVESVILKLERTEPKVAIQMWENLKLTYYHEWLISFKEVDMKDDASWRQRFIDEGHP